jgi:hypothetical protein
MGVGDALKEMFPTTSTFFVFIGYMALFINLGAICTQIRDP